MSPLAPTPAGPTGPAGSGGGGSSQWTTSGSNIYYNTGNIGVGVAVPTAVLDIVKTQNAECF